jgi:hypothetical protein
MAYLKAGLLFLQSSEHTEENGKMFGQNSRYPGHNSCRVPQEFKSKLFQLLTCLRTLYH